MTKVILVTAQPRAVATGIAATLRMAGGGNAKGYYYASNHWRAGVANLSRFSASLGWDENGWTGGVVPTTGTVTWAPYSRTDLASYVAYYWPGAAITIDEGDEDGAQSTRLTGKVADAPVQDNKLLITIADLSVGLDRPVVTARFAGTGGAEGGSEATGRIKRRTWGRAFNIEGRVLDKANNIYEFGDPSYPWQSFETLRDKGRDASPSPTTVAWAGSVAATLTALIASTPVQGSGVVAPSIACAKWWTQPAGPLTADVKGEVGTGYVETAPEIAARILLAVSGPSITNTTTAAGWRAGAAGIHIDEDENINSALNRLLMGVSLLWIFNAAAGTITLREITFSSPVEALISDNVQRERTFPPVKTRRLAYQRSYRIHGDGEIAAALLLAPRVWAAGLTVVAGDLVTEQGMSWQALQDHTSAVGNRPPTLPTTSNSYWSATGPGSPVIGLNADAEAFTFTDGVADNSSASITLTATRQNSSETVNFTTSPSVTLTGSGLTRSLSIANFGTNRQVVATATGATSGATSTVTIVRLEKSTAAAGATAGRNLILNEGAESGVISPWAIDTSNSSGAGNAFTVDTTAPVAGKYKFLLTKVAGADNVNGVHPAISVTPGRKYTFRVSLKASAAAASGLYLRINERSSYPASGIYVTNGQSTSQTTFVSSGPVTTSYVLYEYTYTAPAGVVFVSPIIYNITSALTLSFDSVEFFEQSSFADVIPDSRIIPPSVNLGLIPSLKDAIVISDTANGGTCTINIGSAVYYPDYGGTITFPSGSVAGLAYATQYFLKRTGVDMIATPTGTAWSASTTLTISAGEVYVGFYTTRATSGTPSPPPPPPPGGGLGCVSAEAWVETRERGFVQAREIVAGDMLRVLTDDRSGTRWEACTSNEIKRSRAVRLRAANGFTLTCSITTPITLRDGSYVWAPDAGGKALPVYGDWLRWSTIGVEPIGEVEEIDVAHIRCSQRTYAAGDEPGRSILTHNPYKP